MPATDMSLAGLELGCEVDISGNKYKGRVVSIVGEIADVNLCIDGHYQRVGPFEINLLERDYNDAQEARHRRLEHLMESFPDDGTAMVDDGDTLQRYALVLTCAGVHSEYIIYQFGDTFEDCVRCAGVHVLDNYKPQGVFDLDTGKKIDILVRPPVLEMSASQDLFVNELDIVEPGEVAL